MVKPTNCFKRKGPSGTGVQLEDCGVSGDGRYIVAAGGIVSGAEKRSDSGRDAGEPHVYEASGKLVSRFDGHSAMVSGVAVSGDARVAATCDQTGRVFLWRPVYDEPQAADKNSAATIAAPVALELAGGHSDSANGTGMTPQGDIVVSAGDDQLLKVWNAERGDCIASMPHDESVEGCTISEDARVVFSACSDSIVHCWDARMKGGAHACALRGHEDVVTSCAVDRNARTLVSTSDDGHVILWDLRTNTVLSKFNELEGPYCCSLAPGGSFMVAGALKGVCTVWDVASLTPRCSLAGGKSLVSGCAVADDDSRVVLVDSSGSICTFDISSAFLQGATVPDPGSTTGVSEPPAKKPASGDQKPSGRKGPGTTAAHPPAPPGSRHTSESAPKVEEALAPAPDAHPPNSSARSGPNDGGHRSTGSAPLSGQDGARSASDNRSAHAAGNSAAAPSRGNEVSPTARANGSHGTRAERPPSGQGEGRSAGPPTGDSRDSGKGDGSRSGLNGRSMPSGGRGNPPRHTQSSSGPPPPAPPRGSHSDYGSSPAVLVRDPPPAMRGAGPARESRSLPPAPPSDVNRLTVEDVARLMSEYIVAEFGPSEKRERIREMVLSGVYRSDLGGRSLRRRKRSAEEVVDLMFSVADHGPPSVNVRDSAIEFVELARRTDNSRTLLD